MNTVKQLYNNLMTLCADSDAFFYKDFVEGDWTYRIFNYRLATYTDFLRPDALECRGIMFCLKESVIYIVSRPMEKFFNAGENPFTMNLDYSDIKLVMRKEDGSLISTWLDHLGHFRVKSKGALYSEQATDAAAFLAQKDNMEFRRALAGITEDGFTVNMEWCAPFNRVILQYHTPRLYVLNIRNNITGAYLDEDKWPAAIFTHIVNDYYVPKIDVPFVDYIHSLEGFEGVIVRLGDMHVKIKTAWYSALHAAKDSVDSPKALIAAVLSEGVDDLRALFSDNSYVCDKIDKYELIVAHAFNFAMKELEKFHAEWKDHTRKDYAIAAQARWNTTENDSCFFGIQMNMLVRPEQSVERSVKDAIMKNYKNYVLPDDKGLVEV